MAVSRKYETALQQSKFRLESDQVWRLEPCDFLRAMLQEQKAMEREIESRCCVQSHLVLGGFRDVQAGGRFERALYGSHAIPRLPAGHIFELSLGHCD